MLVYCVRWVPQPENIKGHRSKYKSIDFSVLCRNSSDAVSCLSYVHKKEYGDTDISVSDGMTTIWRMKLDSRHFDVNYLFMDGIRRPLSLGNLKQSIQDLSCLF